MLPGPQALAATPDKTPSTSSVAVTSNGPVMEDYTPPIPAGVSPAEVRIAKAVRHQIVTLPLTYYGKFDDLEYSVQGSTVTLSGSVTPIHAWTRHDVVNAAKRIEGVKNVVDNVKVLPTNPLDAQARRQVLRALLNSGQLTQYFWPISPSIRIIVKNLNLTLKGYVQSESDKNLATITALNVRSLFQVHNDLQVVR
jgi:hypothetical protein